MALLGQPRAFVVPLVSGEINMISQSTIVRGHSTSAAVDNRRWCTSGNCDLWVLAPMPRGSLTARFGAPVAYLVSRRRLELCFANYLIVLCGNFSLGLALA